jgi:hypothetical protein
MLEGERGSHEGALQTHNIDENGGTCDFVRSEAAQAEKEDVRGEAAHEPALNQQEDEVRCTAAQAQREDLRGEDDEAAQEPAQNQQEDEVRGEAARGEAAQAQKEDTRGEAAQEDDEAAQKDDEAPEEDDKESQEEDKAAQEPAQNHHDEVRGEASQETAAQGDDALDEVKSPDRPAISALVSLEDNNEHRTSAERQSQSP